MKATPPSGYRLITAEERELVRHISGYVREAPPMLATALRWTGTSWLPGPYRYLWDDQQYAVPSTLPPAQPGTLAATEHDGLILDQKGPLGIPTNRRLLSALIDLRYDAAAPSHELVNFLRAIEAHAISRGDNEIETACRIEIDRIIGLNQSK